MKWITGLALLTILTTTSGAEASGIRKRKAPSWTRCVPQCGGCQATCESPGVLQRLRSLTWRPWSGHCATSETPCADKMPCEHEVAPQPCTMGCAPSRPRGFTLSQVRWPWKKKCRTYDCSYYYTTYEGSCCDDCSDSPGLLSKVRSLFGGKECQSCETPYEGAPVMSQPTYQTEPINNVKDKTEKIGLPKLRDPAKETPKTFETSIQGASYSLMPPK